MTATATYQRRFVFKLGHVTVRRANPHNSNNLKWVWSGFRGDAPENGPGRLEHMVGNGGGWAGRFIWAPSTKNEMKAVVMSTLNVGLQGNPGWISCAITENEVFKIKHNLQKRK